MQIFFANNKALQHKIRILLHFLLKILCISNIFSNFAAESCKDMNEQYPTAYCVASNYLEDRGWSELIDPRWAPQLLEEFRHSGLGWTDEEIIEVVNEVLFGKAEWDSTDRIEMREDMWPTRQEQINTSITYNGFSEHTLQLIETIYSMEEQILIDLINKSMQASALQIRRSLGRMPYAATREQALNQVAFLLKAKQAAQVIGK